MNLAEQYRQMHRKGTFSGNSIRAHIETIGEIITRTESKTILDYGCGGAEPHYKDALRRVWKAEIVTLYDPYHHHHDKRPTGQFDGVVCCDVMEHIPEDEIDAVLKDIFNFARLFVFLSISTQKARKNLPDGSNAHVTVQPKEWWDAKLEPYSRNLHVSAVYD